MRILEASSRAAPRRAAGALGRGALIAAALLPAIAIADSDLPFVFIRGDSNQDLRVDLADATTTLQFLFFAPFPLSCADAADADDSGSIDISDPIRTLNFLFLGQGALAHPFPLPGVDPSADGLSCYSPIRDADLDPARPLAAAELNEILDREEAEARSGIEGAIVVTGEVFDILSGLKPGDGLGPFASAPGMPEFIDLLLARTPPGGSPVAIPYDLRAPAGADGCRVIDPRSLAGLSADSGPDGTPSGDLAFSVSPPRVCGTGPHLVTFTVTDGDGLSSSAAAMVTLCDPAGAGCREEASPPANSPATPAVPPPAMSCHWIATRSLFPRTRVRFTRGVHHDAEGKVTRVDSNRMVRAGADALEFSGSHHGPGPNHALIAARSSPNCKTPASDLALLGWGDATLRLNLICMQSGDCTIAVVPGCAARVDVEGSYEGLAMVRTEAGAGCEGPTNRIEALAAEETELLVNGSTLFQKGLAVQSGNRIEKSFGFEITASASASGGGIAPEVRVTHGVTHEVYQRTGSREAILRAFASRSFAVPVTAKLTAGGKAELLAEGSGNGLAGAATEAEAVYAFGISNCPGAGSVFVVEASGRGEALKRTGEAIRDFLRQRTGA